MRVAIPTALAPNHIGTALPAQPLLQFTHPLGVGNIEPRHLKRARYKGHGFLKSPIVPEWRGCARGLDKVGVYERDADL